MISQQMISENIKMIQSSLSPSLLPALIHTLPVFVGCTSEDPSSATQR